VVERLRRSDGAATVPPRRHLGRLLGDAQSGADGDGNAFWLGIVGGVCSREELDGSPPCSPQAAGRVAHAGPASHRDEPGEISDPGAAQRSRPEATSGEEARPDDEIRAALSNRREQERNGAWVVLAVPVHLY